ncbi:MAG: beta-lactamase family protein [Gemmatimonadetes bacterium]|nr:beta-lactamase family protein [Gemmatimonadota bacterium]
MRRRAQGPRFAPSMRLFAALLVLWSCAGPPESVDEIFADYDVEGSPGAAVMVIRDSEVVHSAGYGSADLNDGSLLTPSTPVRLGSLSKAFTAMAIVILEEQGRLTFDSRVTEWIPELRRFPDVTIRHLLNHTSGLPDYYDDESGLEGMATMGGRDGPLQNAETVSVYETWGEPVSVPGERYAYSNPGYEILALVVQRIAEMTFGEFLQAEIFAPLQMRTAAVRDLPTTVIPGRAIGYANEDGEWVESDDHWGNWLVGAGGVYASLEDMYQWDQALSRWAEAGQRTDEAFAPAILNDGSESPYGFGWGLSDQLGREAISHGGGWVGFRTFIMRFPQERLSVVVLSNASADATELAASTARLFLGDG